MGQNQSQEKNDAQTESQAAQITALKKKLVHMEARLKLVTAELEQLKAEGAHDKTNFETENCELKSKIEKYEEQCAELQIENERLQKDLQDLKSANISIEEQSQLNLCNTDLTSQITKITESNDFNSLPDEMLINIFSHLSQNELGKIARVCRRWNVLTKSPDLWKHVNVKFHWSHASPNTVAKCFVNMLPSSVTSIKLYYMNRDDWTEQFNFGELCVRLQNRCPHLEKLILEDVILSDSFPSVIDLCTRFLQDVKTLAFHRSRFVDCPAGREFGSDSKIEVLDVSNCHLGQFDELQFPKIPQLRVLNLHYTGIGPKTFQSIRNHGLNMKELYLCGTYVRSEDLSFYNSLLPQLQKICLFHTCYVNAEGIVSIIKSCQSLQKVYIGDHAAPVSMESLAAHPFFVRNRSKFEILIYGCHDSNVN